MGIISCIFKCIFWFLYKEIYIKSSFLLVKCFSNKRSISCCDYGAFQTWGIIKKIKLIFFDLAMCSKRFYVISWKWFWLEKSIFHQKDWNILDTRGKSRNWFFISGTILPFSTSLCYNSATPKYWFFLALRMLASGTTQ